MILTVETSLRACTRANQSINCLLLLSHSLHTPETHKMTSNHDLNKKIIGQAVHEILKSFKKRNLRCPPRLNSIDLVDWIVWKSKVERNLILAGLDRLIQRPHTVDDKANRAYKIDNASVVQYITNGLPDFLLPSIAHLTDCFDFWKQVVIHFEGKGFCRFYRIMNAMMVNNRFVCLETNLARFECLANELKKIKFGNEDIAKFFWIYNLPDAYAPIKMLLKEQENPGTLEQVGKKVLDFEREYLIRTGKWILL